MKLTKSVFLVVALALVVVIAVQAAPPLSGAIFTTTVDGAIVNENVRYQFKEDVYLDGGPGPNAPASAAGLPAGDYYFQVTDPSGKDLLSTDHISCRMIRVNADGVIDFVYSGTNYEYVNDKGNKYWAPTSCQHLQGADLDHAELGAITVQLYPYDDTPNPGGVYKVWVTPVHDYACDDEYVPVDKQDALNNEGCSQFHGFVPAASKTDNYKVKERGKPFYPPEITVLKFHDANFDGIWDAGEEEVTGWAVDFTDPLGLFDTLYTPETVLAAEAGDYTFVEATPAGTLQTVSILDGAALSLFPSADPTVVVPVAGESGETHEVIFGNVGLGSITACKYFDKNGNGIVDEDEDPIAGWEMQLTGYDLSGAYVDLTQYTGEDGCTTFAGLLPGSYTVTEALPANWFTEGNLSAGPIDITSTLTVVDNAPVIAGNDEGADFANYCIAFADFGTKGYWHNKNGIDEIVWEFVESYVNNLSPYAQPSSYFDAGDEPFDGLFENGDPVAASNLPDGIAPAGSWQSEVSQFLVDANADGDPREQLAQQLLAFIFNTEYRLGGDGYIIGFGNASDLITQAITAWETGTAAEQTAIKDVLDGLNNNDAVEFIPGTPAGCVLP